MTFKNLLKNIFRKKSVQGISYLFFVRISDFLSGIVTAFFLFRYFGPAKIGVWAIANSIVGIVGMIELNVGAVQNTLLPKFVIKREASALRSLLYITYAISCISLVITVALTYLFSGRLAQYYGLAEISILLRIIVLKNIIDILSGPVTINVLQGLQDYFKVFILSLIRTISTIAVVITVVLLKKDLVHLALYTIIALVPSVFYSWHCFYKIYLKYRLYENTPVEGLAKKMFLRSFKFIIPSTLPSLSYNVYLYAGNLIAGRFLGSMAVGYFSFSMNIVNKLSDLLKTVSIVLLPKYSEAKTKGMEFLVKIYQKGDKAIFPLSLFSSFITALFAKEITLIIGGKNYLPAVILLQIVSFQLLFRAPLFQFANLFYAVEKPIINTILNFAKVSFELGLYLFLIPAMGLKGLAASVVISYAALNSIYYYAGLKALYPQSFAEKYEQYILIYLKSLVFLIGAFVLSRFYLDFTMKPVAFKAIFLFCLLSAVMLKFNLFRKEGIFQLKAKLENL